MSKKVSVSEIRSALGSFFVEIAGPTDAFIDNVADLNHTTPTSLEWVNSTNKHRQTIAENTISKVIIVDESVEYSAIIKDAGKTLIYVTKPRAAIARILTVFFQPKAEVGIHPTAIVDKEAIIGKDVYIGPYSIIGKVKIGDNTIIETHVRIYDNVTIGNNCHIFDNVVMGSPGFGVEKDENGNLFRFPQIGKLIIGNFVDVGTFTSIDRGALSDTIIGDYTKIDSLCKIGHNTHIGRNVVITGCASIAGSNVIEDGAWIGPNSSLIDWGHVEKNSFVGMGAVVSLKVKEGTRVSGNPARKLQID